MSETPSVGRAWLMAARPQTLPAGAAPVVVGWAVAVVEGVVAIGPAIAALVGALLIQIGTNFANDYFDARHGVDDPDREGFTRVTAGGLIEPRQVATAMAITYALAVVVGLYLVFVGGVPIVLVGLSGIAAGILYTGGPYPYGYYGLGDVFVFLYFGVFAVVGTYYVQAAAIAGAQFPIAPPPGSISTLAIVASLPMAALATAILVVNNVRDRADDRAAGKITLAVRLGDDWARVEYVALVAVAYLVPLGLAIAGALDAVDGVTLAVALPLVTLPGAALLVRTVRRESGERLNDALERTGQLTVVHAITFAVGLALPVVV
ncbi:1,4-dihydroxy-2-naphthoate polyprenyltransferase [Halococcoides cellulosivorans]|uniref:1,4-dihydroxy-2-naphthoate octaprenyltransferase n=1 Tax=Halococcoides cellulosivorans TaxID=1679096 RepID=A0A2R4X116_9EURY|nr:1,4-dihydroxy-2-naphthoate polyprenyltransferase [Halococcoides cellulosivorans]AWB27488.1 1,4-dihydroxy-2-naphthoate polyprenyltransferase [Halococcoides cellulosivorans]